MDKMIHNKKLNLKNVTLIGLDTYNQNRLLEVFQICEHYADFGAKKLITKTKKEFITKSGIEIINTNEVSSMEDYSHFMMKKLNSYVKTKHALIIQHDGFILNPNAWTNEFLEYDYIGAPFVSENKSRQLVVGNGGFSLRSKKLLETLQKESKINNFHPEDYHICKTYREELQNQGIKFAPENIAIKFSIEGDLGCRNKKKYGAIWENEFGFHGLTKTDISKWENPLKI